MKHYDCMEWILYKNNLLDKKIHEEMEEHLLLCDECMDIFLSLIDESEIERAENLVPRNFTENVMDNIKNIRPIKKTVKKKTKTSNDFFIYYTAVASVAIILTASGFFTKVVDTVPQITANISLQDNRVKSNVIYDFSESITNKTSNFIRNFQFRISKED
ncbi:hypothetical protein [Tissierella sp.]|uniref:hypothetical protein n=1 Tax=Tissierella sp. TaxID=41274 RepID=UPI002863D6FB|nr:hypothetical protein [Tissierella sp.]MDR7856834.1 hypothetical protein [Tissierella sp.]